MKMRCVVCLSDGLNNGVAPERLSNYTFDIRASDSEHRLGERKKKAAVG